MADTELDGTEKNLLNRLRDLEKSGFADIASFVKVVLRHYPSPVSQSQPLRLAPAVDDGVSPTESGALVESKDMMMKVLANVDGHYSVSGYGQRGARCFGEFYLCLDAGPAYDREAHKVNAAIQGLSAPAAFATALAETRRVIRNDQAASIDDISTEVLAHVCELWFGLPDGAHMITSGEASLSVQAASCPGDYAPTSAFIFSANPSMPLEQLALFCGSKLKVAGNQAIPRLRSAPLPPDSLSRVILDAFPDDDLAMRTIIGVMMGMLPTCDNNLKNVVKAWQANTETFPRLKAALEQSSEADPYLKANSVLRKPLAATMQLNPVPADIWRTATGDHTLGDTFVRKGDKIAVSITAVTQADAAAGVVDPFPIFGGNRNAREHPLHACPGFEAAMAVMLGVVYGMLEPGAPTATQPV
jgi:hypothetical protein